MSVGNRAYVWTYGGLVVLDVTEPANAVSVATLEIWNSQAYPGRFPVAGGRGYALVGSSVVSLGLDNPRRPIVLGELNVPGAKSTVASGDFVYVASARSGVNRVSVIDAREPLAPVVIWESDPGGQPRALALECGTLVVTLWRPTAQDWQVVTYDLADPRRPRLGGAALLPLNPDPGWWTDCSTAISGGVAYAVCGGWDSGYDGGGPSGSLLTVDVSDPLPTGMTREAPVDPIDR